MRMILYDFVHSQKRKKKKEIKILLDELIELNYELMN